MQHFAAKKIQGQNCQERQPCRKNGSAECSDPRYNDLFLKEVPHDSENATASTPVLGEN